MKLTAYKDLESSKRAQTLGRIAVIGGAHLFLIGGAYLVTQFGGAQGEENASLAGAVTWSSQASGANQPTVDAAADSLFDRRAGDLSGYNAGDASRATYAANTSSSRSGRFAPRRPSDSDSSDSRASTQDSRPRSSRAPDRDDEVLQPLNRPGSNFAPAAPSGSSRDSGLSGTIDYTVQNGDSLWGLSKRFGVSVSEITAVNPGIKANAIRVGQVLNIPRSSATEQFEAGSSASSNGPPAAIRSTEVPNGSIYTVKAGDSLSRIASRQGVTVAELKAINGLSDNVIRIGQELVVPSNTRSSDLAARQHRGPKVTIEAGDTLGKYAAAYGVSVRELMDLNGIDDPRQVRIGQTLLIPGNSGSTGTTESASASPPQERRPSRSTAEPSVPPRVPQQTLESLESPEPQSGRPNQSLPSLADEFGDEDLDEQPLVPISD